MASCMIELLLCDQTAKYKFKPQRRKISFYLGKLIIINNNN